MGKYMPGPWTYYRDDEANMFCFRDGYGHHIATLDGPRKGTIEATARLIAAAPELLEAAKFLVDKISPVIHKLNVRKHFSEKVALVAVEKAIAKAEGRES